MAACGYGGHQDMGGYGGQEEQNQGYGQGMNQGYGQQMDQGYGQAAPSMPNPGPGGDCESGDCEGMLKTVVTMKKVSVPCQRKEYKHYTIKVPKQVTVDQPRKVTWTDYVKETKSVPFTDYKMENRVKFKNVQVCVPDVKTVTDMVKITTKVPKTVNKTIKIPYQASVKFQNFKQVTNMVPVKKSKMVVDKVQKTIYETKPKTSVITKTVMCSKQVPVYSVVCQSNQNNNNQGISQELQQEFNSLDLNSDGNLSPEEYAAARQGAMNQGGGGGGGYGQQMSSGYSGQAMASSGAAMQASSGAAMQASSGMAMEASGSMSGAAMQASSGAMEASLVPCRRRRA